MNKQIVKQLEEMKGGQFTYAKQVHEIRDFIVNDEESKVTIITDKNRFDRKFESIKDFLSYWEPVKEVPAVTESKQAPVLPAPVVMESKDVALADEMIAILRDNIQKVQENSEYVKQAQTINNNVNSIINIVRTKMDFMKQVKGK